MKRIIKGSSYKYMDKLDMKDFAKLIREYIELVDEYTTQSGYYDYDQIEKLFDDITNLQLEILDQLKYYEKEDLSWND